VKVLLAALALLLIVALAQPGAAQSWPSSWKAVPSDTITRETKAAAQEFGVPVLLLLALAYVETGGTFKTQIRGKKHAGNTERFAVSYRTWRNRIIPGSTLTWGSKFTPSTWAPTGTWQLMPYHLWGVTVPGDAPLEAGFDARANVRAAAKVLRDARKTGGSWTAAIRAYNYKPLFRVLVTRVYRALGGNVSALEGGNT
jgi:hypothetical protein